MVSTREEASPLGREPEQSGVLQRAEIQQLERNGRPWLEKLSTYVSREMRTLPPFGSPSQGASTPPKLDVLSI